MNRMPVSRLSWRPLGLGAVRRPYGPSYGLGQAQAHFLVVEVVDVSGNPVRDAAVDIAGGGASHGSSSSAVTGKDGKAVFDVLPGDYTVRANYNGLVVLKKLTKEEMLSDATAFVQFPTCIMGSLIRPIDFVIFSVAGGMIAAGSYWKIKPLEMTGEIALGAAVFGFIYRLQCM